MSYDNNPSIYITQKEDPLLYKIIQILQEKEKRDADKLEYYKYEKLVELIKIIIQNKGKVFGGCPRDLILREINSNKFWEYCKENNLNFINNFYNPTIYPETFDGRTKLPNDIDIQCINSSLENLLETLKELGFTLTKLEVPELYRPSYGINHDKYKLEYKPKHSKTKTTLETLYNEQLYYSIKIDIIYASTQKELDKYFNTKLDFMCNQLQITSAYERDGKTVFNYECMPNILEFKKDQNGNPYKSSIDNSLLPYELLKNIIKQIEEKKAYVLFPDAYRIDKMMLKEYELVYVECIYYLNYYIKKESQFNTLQITPVNNSFECNICLNDEDNRTNITQFLNIKVKCCSNHSIHLKCFIINIRSQYEQSIPMSCAICRNEDLYIITPDLLDKLYKYIIKLDTLSKREEQEECYVLERLERLEVLDAPDAPEELE